MGATYKFIKCIECGKNAKTERVYEGMDFGNPLFHCKNCGALNYDKGILEPALISPTLLIKDGQKRFNTLLLLLYMPIGLFAFFSLALIFENFLISTAIVSPPLALLTYLILKKRSKVSIDEYSKVIEESIRRLETDVDYAKLVVRIQGNHPDSAWSKKYPWFSQINN